MTIRVSTHALGALLIPMLLAGCNAVGNWSHGGVAATNTATLEPVRGEIRTVAMLQIRPGNVAVSAEGRVFSTIHPMDGDHDVQLIEVTGPHSYRAWPSTEVQTHNGNYQDATIDSPLGIALDGQGGLWITDTGNHLGKTRIWGFTIASGELIQKVTLPADVAPKGSFIQDLVVDRKRGFAYLADIANPGLLTVNLASGDTWRFQGHASLQPQPNAPLVINGEAIQFGGAPANVGANPITLSDDRSTVYFGAMNGLDWFSVPARLLRKHASAQQVADAIVRVGPKPVSDGADTDAEGRHFFTNLNHNGIDALLPGGSLEPLVRDERLSWPDSVRMGPQGWLYVAVNQLHKAPPFTGGKDQGKPPYSIYKVWVGSVEE
ncbi:major royal jelly protein [Marinobacter sp. LV10R520-4]|uniref:L-dopachrome tautomerase-related protein n=1 Tax=Marinobacter sp. LV10R520-4 TaxID=1761796 RepID=UPI000BF3821A|nr:L-dopachrome tautomerase-related protein [Marinobacter sp. LV10R520-4]PFG54534.1 major royal jelly protein [Marinobacter sp. LV10R520-4]